MNFENNQDLIKIKNAAIHKMPILHYDGNGFRSSIHLVKDNSDYYIVQVTDDAMLAYIATELKESDKVSVMGEFSIEHWKNKQGNPYHTTHIQAQYLQINSDVSFEFDPRPAISLQFRLMVFVAQNLPDISKVSTPFDATTMDDIIKKVVINIYPNDKKRHNVENLRAARDKVRKILKDKCEQELKCIEENNKDLLEQLTDKCHN